MDKIIPKDMSGQINPINILLDAVIGGCCAPLAIDDMTAKSSAGKHGIRVERDVSAITTLQGFLVRGIKGFDLGRMLFVYAELCSIHPKGHHSSVQGLARCVATSVPLRSYLLENKLITI